MILKNLIDIQEKEIVPGFRAKFIHSNNMTIAYWNIKANALMPEHSHPHEQVVNMIDGEFELIVEDKAQTLKPGMVVIIPSSVKHYGKAITDCSIIDVFYPVREDYC
jgi:quercetin dioxygenase-like cupin family protein